uniref:Uncharacterized protein n=1 Tax=Arundo donax TaxID=35708 RepID=A0A0A8Y8D7_ARUDO
MLKARHTRYHRSSHGRHKAKQCIMEFKHIKFNNITLRQLDSSAILNTI